LIARQKIIINKQDERFKMILAVGGETDRDHCGWWDTNHGKK